MIDWDKTFNSFGYNKLTIKTREKVVVKCKICNGCFERNYGSIKKTLLKNGGSYFCHDCSTKTDNFKRSCSARASELWQQESYIKANLEVVKSENYRKAKQQESLDRWQDSNFRAFMLSDEMKAIRSENSRRNAIRLWKSKEYREKLVNILSNRMKEQWKNEDYRHLRAKSQSDISKKLWAEGVFDKSFGLGFKEKMRIINIEILSRQDVKDKLSLSSKRNWNSLEYRNAVILGNRKKWDDTIYKEKMAIIRSNQPRESNIQRLLYEYLDDLGVDYVKEGPDTKIGYYVFDCLVNTSSKKLLIECQGDYWHNIAGASSRDKAKFTYINNYFPDYEIMYVWEHEFYTKDRVLDRLKLKVGRQIDVVDFNIKDVIVLEVGSLEVKSFLDAYHYVGKGRGGKTYAAYYEGELIGCVVYSPPLRQNINIFEDFVELSRFCIHPSYHKKNFASWLISKTFKLIGKNVVSYADTTIGHNGTIYKAANFKLHHEVQPDYWYVDSDGYIMHKRTLYGRARKMSLSENAFAVKYGYSKKYGGVKLCFCRAK